MGNEPEEEKPRYGVLLFGKHAPIIELLPDQEGTVVRVQVYPTETRIWPLPKDLRFTSLTTAPILANCDDS
jgi:hypothetical protein